MNWIEIYKKYPLAFNTWYKEVGWDESYAPKEELARELTIDDLALYSRRDLYDFFDSNEIIVLPYMFSCNFLWKIKYDFKMSEDELYGRFEKEVSGDNTHTSRPEAESAAFTKAFEILNDKLKNK